RGHRRCGRPCRAVGGAAGVTGRCPGRRPGACQRAPARPAGAGGGPLGRQPRARRGRSAAAHIHPQKAPALAARPAPPLRRGRDPGQRPAGLARYRAGWLSAQRAGGARTVPAERAAPAAARHPPPRRPRGRG
nr:hypothetical protein [Tanacetum cinerariifolium]